ncbi:MAG: biotin transporter BioY [Oscillatoriales cyanobacterium]|nr:MAG: biotin transporter BioY [Oscillatoriales cyanobacterium]
MRLETLLWAAIGVLLSIAASFVEVFVPTAPWQWLGDGLQVVSLGTRYQVAAVLLVACLGGGTAAALSQVAYLALGLVGLPIFEGGGGWQYLGEPSFGYLLGFVPAGWLCGRWAFLGPPKVEQLAIGCAIGLVALHSVGLLYAMVLRSSEFEAIAATYSQAALPGQAIAACAAATIASVFRHLVFY